MATVRQRRVARLIIKNATLDKPKTGGEIVESSGYGVSMKKNPQVILKSEGVSETLTDYGFSEDNAKKVVASILLNDDADSGHRLKAASEVFKVQGTYAPEKSVSLNIEVPIAKQKIATDAITRFLNGNPRN